MEKTWNLKYHEKSIKYIHNNFKSHLFNESLSFNLTDSYMNNLDCSKKLHINSKNILLWNFVGLELTIEQFYLPIFIAMKTTVNNVYIIYSKTLKIYKVTELGQIIPILCKNLDIKSIDTFINPREDINSNNFLKYNNISKIFGKYIPKNIINLNYGNNVCVIKTKMYIQPNLNNCVLYRGICPYKSNYLWKNAKPWNQKQKMLIYPGTFNNNNDKNQLSFVQLLDKDILMGYKILFVGNMKKNCANYSYLKSLESLLIKKNIDYEIGCLDDDMNVFLNTLLQCRGLIFYGVHLYDRVRVLTEGLFANLPFIVNDSIKTIPDLYFECGYKVKNNNKKDLNDKIKKLIDKDWGNEPIELTKKYFQIDKLSEEIVNQINIRTN